MEQATKEPLRLKLAPKKDEKESHEYPGHEVNTLPGNKTKPAAHKTKKLPRRSLGEQISQRSEQKEEH